MTFVLGLGMAHIFIPSQTAAFATISHERSGGASTLFNVQRQVGSAIGVAVLSSVLAAIGPVTVTPAGAVPNFTAYHWGFAVAAVMALAGHRVRAAGQRLGRGRDDAPSRSRKADA